MAKYGDFVYGSGTKYGTGDPVATAALTGKIAWIFQVDWNNDGILDGVNEAANMKDLPSFYRGRSYYISSGGDGFEAFQEGRVSIVLENTSRRYDPWYTSSPLYPNVVPSRKCQ